MLFPDPLFQFLKPPSHGEILVTEDKLNKIGNNVYIADFLNYILIFEPRHRPTISSVLKRFEHIHAILVPNITDLDHSTLSSLPPHSSQVASTSLEGILETYVEALFSNQEAIQEMVTIPHKLKHVNYFKG